MNDTESDFLNIQNFNQLELYFNNTCDLKCVYCNETFSSQWEIENGKFDIKPSEKKVAPEGFQDLFYEWLEQDAVPHDCLRER